MTAFRTGTRFVSEGSRQDPVVTVRFGHPSLWESPSLRRQVAPALPLRTLPSLRKCFAWALWAQASAQELVGSDPVGEALRADFSQVPNAVRPYPRGKPRERLQSGELRSKRDWHPYDKGVSHWEPVRLGTVASGKFSTRA
jgi:hypothetical protein